MSGSGWLECQIARRLLAGKLIGDFYDEYAQTGTPFNSENSLEWLKTVLPAEQHELFYRWEAVYAERCGKELRQFADFVTGILMMDQRHE